MLKNKLVLIVSVGLVCVIGTVFSLSVCKEVRLTYRFMLIVSCDGGLSVLSAGAFLVAILCRLLCCRDSLHCSYRCCSYCVLTVVVLAVVLTVVVLAVVLTVVVLTVFLPFLSLLLSLLLFLPLLSLLLSLPLFSLCCSYLCVPSFFPTCCFLYVFCVLSFTSLSFTISFSVY